MSKQIICTCLQCGKQILRYPYEIKKRVYCSRECYGNNNRMEYSTSWHGGRTINGEGYVCIYKPNYPKVDSSGYVYEHILVAEQGLGRSLIEGEVVHHLNEIKTDNRFENLSVIPKGTHSHIHLSNIGNHRWSKNYICCERCGQTNSPYKSRGLCVNCYWQVRKEYGVK
jgi:hypothetical protein